MSDLVSREWEGMLMSRMSKLSILVHPILPIMMIRSSSWKLESTACWKRCALSRLAKQEMS